METYPTHSGLKRCAKCGFEESVQSLECRRCGVIFSKLGHIRESSEPDSTPLDAYLSSAEEFQAEPDFHTDAHVDTYTPPYTDSDSLLIRVWQRAFTYLKGLIWA